MYFDTNINCNIHLGSSGRLEDDRENIESIRPLAILLHVMGKKNASSPSTASRTDKLRTRGKSSSSGRGGSKGGHGRGRGGGRGAHPSTDDGRRPESAVDDVPSGEDEDEDGGDDSGAYDHSLP